MTTKNSGSFIRIPLHHSRGMMSRGPDLKGETPDPSSYHVVCDRKVT